MFTLSIHQQFSNFVSPSLLKSHYRGRDIEWILEKASGPSGTFRGLYELRYGMSEFGRNLEMIAHFLPISPAMELVRELDTFALSELC